MMTFVFGMLAAVAMLSVFKAVFGMKPTNWDESDMYDEPQSFTDVGLEAEWQIPVPIVEAYQQPNYATAVESVIIDSSAFLPVVATPAKKTRQRTIAGWTPPNNKRAEGMKALSRKELAEKIHNQMCPRSCDSIFNNHGSWHCSCGVVAKYANVKEGMIHV